MSAVVFRMWDESNLQWGRDYLFDRKARVSLGGSVAWGREEGARQA
jgi:hypothetical protein